MLLFLSASDNFLSASARKKFRRIKRRTPLPLLLIDISSSDFIDNLKSWITMKTVDQFGLPFGIFLDSDRISPTNQTKNTSTVEKNRKHGRTAFCTRKREAENYLHPDIFDGHVNITDYNDVKEEVKNFNQTNENKVLQNNWPKMTVDQIHEQEKYIDEDGIEHFELTEIVKEFLSLV